MNKKTLFSLILLAVILAAVFSYNLKQKEASSREIAVLVNSQPIYADEIDMELATLTPEQRETTTYLEVIDFLIEKKLLLQEAEKENVAATPEDVDSLFTIEAQELMLDQDITKKLFMQRLAEQATISKLLDKKTNENFVVKNSEVMQIYDSSYKERNVSLEDAEKEILQVLLEQKRENLKVSYINSLKTKADIIALIDFGLDESR